MLKLKDYKECSTRGIHLLDSQLIAQIQLLAPGALVRFDYLPVRVGSGCHPYLQEPAAKALERGLKGKPGAFLECNSAYRTIAQQFVLYNHYCNGRRCGIVLAARPGSSNHETAIALDIDDAQSWRPYLAKVGWDWLGSKDPMHFDYRGANYRDMRRLSVLGYQRLWNLNHPQQKLKEDGILGKATYDALALAPVQGFAIAPKPTDGPVPTAVIASKNFPPLREGMQGAAVKSLQKALNKRGYKLGEDGIFGAATEAAVMRCQLEANLASDGVVGLATSRALGLG